MSFESESMQGLREDMEQYGDVISKEYVADLAWGGLQTSIENGWITEEAAQTLFYEWFNWRFPPTSVE